MVRPRLRNRNREWRGGLSALADDGRLLETCTWEIMRAERGTWEASVGLSELMRDSIFSASLLQASICKEKTLSVKPQTRQQSSQANSRQCQKETGLEAACSPLPYCPRQRHR